MFTEKDLEQIRKRGMNLEMVQSQIDAFERGFPHANLERPCTLGDGIVSLQSMDHKRLIEPYARAADRGRIMKFVPASGAASRMFKSLLSVLGRMDDTHGAPLGSSPETDPDRKAFSQFLSNIHRFPFCNSLDNCLRQDALDIETLLQSFHDRQQRFNIGGVARPHLTAYGLPLVVDDRPDDHLLEIRAMIFAKAPLADGFPSGSFEVNRGGIEEHQIELGKKIPTMPENMLFNQVLVAARGEGCGVFLIFELFSQKAHHAV